MKFTEIKTEEKVRLDPKCWTGKKIGNPKTKMKGGVRVNNCVPAESVEETMSTFSTATGASTANSGAGEFRGVNIPSDMKHPEWKEPTWSFQEIAEKLGIPVSALNLIAFKRIGGFPEAQPGLSSRYGSKKYYKQSEIKRWVNANQVREKLKAGLVEEYNPEYDDEAGMADNNLETLKRTVQGIDDIIDTGDNLPEWCQEKIAVAKSMLVAVWDYMESADDAEEEEDPEIAEMYEAMEELAEEMAARKGVSADLVWESFESMDDNMLYETAAWRRKEGKSKTGGLNAKGVASYRRENPGSKLQTAVTTKPSKLKKGSKAAKRRKSFCARMSGVKGPMKKPNGKPTRKALALRKWNC
jgi:hypothetical protein